MDGSETSGAGTATDGAGLAAGPGADDAGLAEGAGSSGGSAAEGAGRLEGGAAADGPEVVPVPAGSARKSNPAQPGERAGQSTSASRPIAGSARNPKPPQPAQPVIPRPPQPVRPSPLLVVAQDLVADLHASFTLAWHGPRGRDLRLAGRAAGHAALAAVATWLAAVAVCLTVWLISAPDTSGFDGPLRVAGQLWLVAHRVSLTVPAGRVALAPLGFTAVCVLVLVHAAVGPITRAAQLPYAALGSATGYSAAAALIAVGARTSDVRPDTAQAVLAAVCFGALVPTAPHWRRVVALGFPLWTEDAAQAAAAALAVLLGGGAVLFAGSLVTHDFVAKHAAPSAWPAGFADAIGMFLLVLALLPNAVTWAAAYLAGPGFAVGTGTGVGPFGVRIGAMPSFPPLTAVPARSTYPYALAALAVPVAAGICLGVLIRLTRRPLRESLRATSAATAAAAACVGLLATLSGGPIAGGRMATLGPSGWRTAAATLVVLGASSCAVVVLPDLVRAVRRWSVKRMLADARAQGADAWGQVARTAAGWMPKRREVEQAEGAVLLDLPTFADRAAIVEPSEAGPASAAPGDEAAPSDQSDAPADASPEAEAEIEPAEIEPRTGEAEAGEPAPAPAESEPVGAAEKTEP